MSILRDVANYTPVVISGRNTDVDLAAAEDIWTGGAVYAPPTAARLHTLVSGSAADASDGTGARTITVIGLDSSFLVQSETVTLNGTTGVSTTKSYRRILSLRVATAGSGLANAGAITATAATDSTVSARIEIGKNRSEMAIYTVPAGKTAYFMCWYGSINLSLITGAVDLSLLVKFNCDVSTSVYENICSRGVVATGTSSFTQASAIPFPINGPADIKIQCAAKADNHDVSAGFELALTL